MTVSEHLFSSTDDFAASTTDIRNRAPVPWDVRLSTLGQTKNGVDVGTLLQKIEVLPQNGLVLVDGHHLFLHALRIAHFGIDTWNKHSRHSDPKSPIQVPLGSKCPYEPISPRLLTHIAGQLMHRTVDLATRHSALDLVPDGKLLISSDHSSFIDPDWVFENIDPEKFVVLDTNWNITACDAGFPERQDYEQRLRERNKRYPEASRYLEWEIKNIEQGKIRIWVGKRHFTEQYSLKNDYLSDLEKNYFVASKHGIKKLQFNNKTHNPWFREKQVDVQLTMAMCDAARNEKLDWVCVVTNDSDYVPAIARMQAAGKKIIWLCADELESRSKDLLTLVGNERSFVVSDLFGNWKDGSSKMFLKLFEYPGIFRSLELQRPWAEPDGGFTMSPWDKSYREYCEELDD